MLHFTPPICPLRTAFCFAALQNFDYHLLTDAIRDAPLVGAGNACVNLSRSTNCQHRDVKDRVETYQILCQK